MKEGHKARVAVGLSGGVDSSVAAALVMEMGYEVLGLTMEIYDGAVALPETDRQACYGPCEKEDVEVAERRESQDFIAGGDYLPLFSAEELRVGEIVDQSGNVLGKHRGIMRYTIGQRRGLGIASSKPLYVVRIDAHNNQVVVSHKEPFSQGVIVTDINLIALEAIEQPQQVEVKIRLQHRAAPAIVYPPVNSRTKIIFQKPQPSVTPGQSAVLYSGDMVYGGGVIQSVF